MFKTGSRSRPELLGEALEVGCEGRRPCAQTKLSVLVGQFVGSRGSFRGRGEQSRFTLPRTDVRVFQWQRKGQNHCRKHWRPQTADQQKILS